MRFIGNKENLVGKIYQAMQAENIKGNVFFDAFAGTANVGKFFKHLNYQVFSADILYFSFILQKAYISNNQDLQFSNLLKKIQFKGSSRFFNPLEAVVEFLNNLPPKKGFIFKNYTPEGTADLEKPRMYFIAENGQIIDSIRQQIEEWKNENLINENEYFVLLACLIETVPFYANISGVYAAFQKKWDARAIKKLKLRPISLVINGKENFAFNADSTKLARKIETDILYLDPPYNHRQYAPNYHLLETIAKYDNPIIKGIAGLRDYQNQKSKFCNKETALQELYKIAKEGNYKNLLLSYNSEGTMPQEKIFEVLSQFGETKLVEFDYLRFKSNSNGESKTKKFIKEQLYILKKK